MLKTKRKKLLALIMAGIMMCGNIPSYAAETQTQTEEVTLLAEEEFAVSFNSSYAEVGKPLTVSVTGASDVTYNWYIDGVQSDSHGSSYTPTENDLEKWIEVRVTYGTETVSAKTYFSKLPVVYIDTENGQSITSKTEYIDAQIKIQGNAEYNDTDILYEGATEIRGRGNSTWSQPKKPYKLKLGKKTNVFGMGKSKHWVLLANYLDESLMRNTLAYRLAGAMEMDEMSTVWVDVIMNGEYIGNYQLCENVRVDTNRVEITDWEGFAEDSADTIADAEGLDKTTKKSLETYMSEHMEWITSGQVTYNGVTYNIADYSKIKIPNINGGYLLELDEYWDEVSKFKTDSGQPLQFKSPEYVNTNSDMFEYVQEYVQAFEDAVQSTSYTAEYEGTDTHYSDLYDLDALVDYWLVTEIFFNEEMNKKSTYMYKAVDGKMIMGPIWDMDWSSGAGGTSAGATNQWATNYFNTNAQRYQWYKYLVKDPYFLMKLQERYWEIRDDQLQGMLDSMEVYYEQIKESGKADSSLWHWSGTFDSDYQGLKTWLNTHVNWMDQQMDTEDSFDSAFLSKSSQLALSLTDTEGNALLDDYAENAPADAFAGKSTDLLLHISGNIAGTANVYINSKLAGTVSLNGQETTYTIAASDLTEELETKNVIEVKVKNNYGSVSASNYITVRQSTCDHSFGETWSKNDTQHWKECEHCQLQLGLADHTFEWVIDKEATENENGIRHEECTVCGYARSAESYEYAELPENAEDDSKDLPISGMTAISASEYPGTGNEGPDDLILDNDANTHWHTNYGAVAEGQQLENRWVGVTLDEASVVCGIRCLPRANGGNGVVTEYEVQYRTTDDESEEWITVASGTWDYNDLSWKLVTFDPVVAKQVRIVGVHTYYSNHSSQGDRHMSMAEFRVVGKAVKDTEEADKTILKEVLAEAKELEKTDYTSESWEAADLENIIAAAEIVFADENAVQAVVDEAVHALETAMEKLERKAEVDIPTNIIPVSEMKATAGDSQESEGPEKAIDEDESTLWHTDWYIGDDHEDHWLQLELNDVYEITSFQYLPRQSGRNGIITEYEIYVSLDGIEWQQAAKGSWKGDSSLKAAVFEAVEAKYVKLVTINALSDQNVKFASAAEVRLTGTKVETPVDPPVTVDKTELEAVIAQAQTLEPSAYQDFTEVETALKNAKNVYADENADEETVKEAVETLRRAIGNLKEKENLSEAKAELAVLIQYAESLNAADYEDFTAVEKALKEAKKVYEDENTTLEIIAEIYEQLTEAIEALEEKEVIVPENTIPVSEMKATAGDFQEEEGPENVLDENENTTWHTNWYAGNDHEDHWLQLELKDVYEISKFFYLPRQSGTNGIITKYEIHVSMDGQTWEKAAEGEWEADSSWKMAEFEPTEAKYVRLVTVEALSNQKIVFASAAEVRLTGTKVETSVDPDPSVTVDKTELKSVIENAESLNPADYKDFTAVEKALATAKEVYADEKADEETVKAAVETLRKAIEALEEKEDLSGAKEELAVLIQYAESLNAADYEDFTAVENALKTAKNVYEDGNATLEAIMTAYDELVEAIEALTEKDDTPDIPVEENKVKRLSGTDRYATGYAVADELKAVLGVEKFETVIIATGTASADALSGSYLAAVKNAPILLTNGKAANVEALHAYIKANVKAGATIYVLGGEKAVSAEAAAIEGYDVVRLAGSSRYETNLKILAEAGYEGQEDLLVATGKDFADSLSASAAARPILLVKPNTALTDAQKAVADNFKNIYVIGGENAVSKATEDELAAYGNVTRLSGSSRYETSVKVAETFFENPETVLLAYGKKFPDGLCGGALAAALNAPLVLTKEGAENTAANYVTANGIASGYVLGGEGAVSNETVVTVFGLESAEEIK